MTQPTVLSGTKLMIFVGDGGTPESFLAPCGLTTNGIDFAASTNNTVLADPNDPDGPVWESKDMVGLSAQVSGAGVMAVESFAVWNDWFQSSAIRNVKILVDHPSLGSWIGAFGLSSLKYTGSRGQKITLDVTLVNSGAVPWAPAVAPPVLHVGIAAGQGIASALATYKIVATGAASGSGSAGAVGSGGGGGGGTIGQAIGLLLALTKAT